MPITPELLHWRFGPDWPGRRCLAKTRRTGEPCQKPALKGRNRCQIHGGRAGAPSGPRNGAFIHGKCTKSAIMQRRADMKRVKALERLARQVGMIVD